MDADDKAPMPSHIDRYVLRRVLGQGAMGQVFAAWDPKLGREVAIKIVARGQRQNTKGQARFEREAQAIAAIRHPNVVQIYDYSGIDSDDLYLVIEKLDGQDLFASMQQHGMMPEAVAVAVGHELCLALEAAHNAGIIHRDLKPENVFLNGQGRVVLTDFGIVKAVAGNATIDGYREKTEVIGTPGFMSPEHMRGLVLSPSVDLFALGALMYNIATLHMPFAGTSAAAVYQAALHGDMPDPRDYNPTLSPEFCRIIAHCLARDPRRRPKSAKMLRLALMGVLEDLGVADLREDLRDYVQDPVALALRVKHREVAHVLRSLKVAKQDADRTGVARLAKRMGVLDPFNGPAQALMADVTDLSSKDPEGALAGLWRTNVEMLLSASPRSMLGGGGPKRWPALAAAGTTAALLIAVGFAGGTGLILPAPQQPKPVPHLALALPPVQALPKTSPEATVPMASEVDIEVVGTAGEAVTVSLDGYVMAGQASHHEGLNPGRHLLEVVAQGVTLRRHVAVAAGEHLNLVADMAHRLLMVR